MNNSSSGRKLERFFTGKGFYIVLFLCAAVIGVSAWMMTAGNVTMSDEHTQINNSDFGSARTETIIVPAAQEPAPAMDYDGLLLPEPEQGETAPAAEIEDEPAEEVWTESAEMPMAPEYVWPVSGDIDRAYHTDQLRYDATMADWRIHDGIDIAAPIGTSVCACRAGRVESIVSDDLYGTTLTIDHGDGTRAVYANLADITAVNVDDYVQGGDVLGAVGSTAICESAQEAHLHFAMSINGESADPLAFLNA